MPSTGTTSGCSPAPTPAPLRHLRDCGFDGETVRRYRLGGRPTTGTSWPVPSARLLPKVLRDAGLGRESKRCGTNDFFRARILFPISRPQGDPIGFGGRMLPGGRPPKYQNTPETALYRKSKVLYGLNWAKDEAVRTDEVIICEGYTDVIGFASVGLARRRGHLRHRPHRRARAHPPALRPVGAGSTPMPPASRRRPRHEWEKHTRWRWRWPFSAGADPADLARTDPDRLRQVEGAVPFLGFRLERILGPPTCAPSRAGPRRPNGRSRRSASIRASSSGTST
ncbi:MAG: hypothetical protein R2746_00780 [Acidimicrobiales bacterium]